MAAVIETHLNLSSLAARFSLDNAHDLKRKAY